MTYTVALFCQTLSLVLIKSYILHETGNQSKIIQILEIDSWKFFSFLHFSGSVRSILVTVLFLLAECHEFSHINDDYVRISVVGGFSRILI